MYLKRVCVCVCSSFHVGKTFLSSIFFCNFPNGVAFGEHYFRVLIMYTLYALLAHLWFGLQTALDYTADLSLLFSRLVLLSVAAP